MIYSNQTKEEYRYQESTIEIEKNIKELLFIHPFDLPMICLPRDRDIIDQVGT